MLLSWAMNFESNISYALTTNVTFLFKTNNLISILSTVLYILETALYPIYSKLSDIYGRAQCYTVAIVFYMIAYIIMATANSYENLVVSHSLHLTNLDSHTCYLGRSSCICFWLYRMCNPWPNHYCRLYQCC